MSEPNRRFEFGVNPDVIPIEIRKGVFVYIQGLPHDLTQAEARKIANVVVALSPSREDEGK